MKWGIIDIGSNSIRLTLYEVGAEDFKILFREKIMAGLAGYVVDGNLSAEGIECACSGLLTFQNILNTLKIENISVFATASLRNIGNTETVLAIIHAATGYSVEILSGEDEALMGYNGAMREFNITSGAFFDIGGASTEIVTFDNSASVDFSSFSIGSLSLYHGCVKKIIPGKGSLNRLRTAISKTIDERGIKTNSHALIVGVGGTARAVMKIARHYYKVSDECHSITAEQLHGLCKFLCSGKRGAIDIILRLEPDRIHTIIPGILILEHIFNLFDAGQLIVSKYGVREGYLCQRILKNNTDIHKIVN